MKKEFVALPIFHDINTIFVRIPKTGSTTIGHALSNDRDWKVRPEAVNSGSANGTNIHSTALEIKTHVGQDCFDSYFKFSFSRNPFDWFVSKFKYFNGPYKESMGIAFEEWIFGLERVMNSRDGDYFNYNPYFPSENLISCGHGRCETAKGRECGCLSMTQNGFLCAKGSLLVDFVGKMENINNDWEYIASRIGDKVPSRLCSEYKNKREHSRDSYASEFSDKRVVDIVYRIFKKDCELFGYSVDDYKW